MDGKLAAVFGLAQFCFPFLADAGAIQPSVDLPIGEGFAGWVASGDAFKSGIVSGKDINRLGIQNAEEPVATSKADGDGPKGTLMSLPFRISRRFIAFRIGGGDYQHETCLNLLVRGRIVRSATGWRSDRLTPTSWDVGEFRGQSAQIEIVDHVSGDWGHIDVDRIVQTDKPERLPVVTGPLYQESLRPQFHVTARQWTVNKLNPARREEGWINDLNGLIYYDGEYHMFAQRWNKAWLHFVSRDLVHWTELEPAFIEEELESGCQSGTCVIDYDNTSGLATSKDHPAMIAFWSKADNRSQCFSYSLDHGRTWKFYEKNPFMIYPERDPKVFWYAPGKHWVMVMYGDGQYHIFTSPNLLDWTDAKNPIPNSYECPDFFEMPIDGDASRKKWVLIQGNGKYSIGTFDGFKFTEESERFPCDIGPQFYATQSWANVETGDGRRVQAAWLAESNFPDMPFSQQISFPCELTLRTTPAGLRVYREPVKEIATLHRDKETWGEKTLQPGETLPLEPSGRMYHIQAEVEVPIGSKLVFDIRGESVVLTSSGVESGPAHGQVQDKVSYVEILVDRTSIETFVNHGEVSSTRFVLPHQNGISIRAEGGPATVKSVTVYPLQSAWKDGVSD